MERFDSRSSSQEANTLLFSVSEIALSVVFNCSLISLPALLFGPQCGSGLGGNRVPTGRLERKSRRDSGISKLASSTGSYKHKLTFVREQKVILLPWIKSK